MNSKIKVLYTIPEFMFGSKVRQLCDMINWLDHDTFETEICTTDLGDEASFEIEELKVPIYQEYFYPPRNIKKSAWLKFLKSPLFVHEKKYDIIHSLHYSSVFTEPFICKTFNKTKYVYTKSNLQWENHPFQWYWKSVLSDSIITCSEAGSQLLTSKGFEKKILKIHIGVNCGKYSVPDEIARISAREAYGVPKKAFVFGYAAQFIKVKDHLTLLKAFLCIKKQYEHCILIFCGDNYNDHYYHSVLDFIKGHQLTDSVRLLGTLSDMKKFYALCDCLVFPSSYENFSIVILEAMSSGLPIIASRYGGNLEQVIHGQNGFLVDVGNQEGFANFMQTYLKNPELCTAHGNASRDIAESQFSVQMMVKKTQELYLALLKQ